MDIPDQQLALRPDRRVEDRTEPGDPDAALVAAAQSDRAAFAPLYQRYVDAVYRFCYRRLADRAAAEDAVSRVFERALIGLPNYRDGSFRAWLFTIARHAVADVHRTDRGEQPLDAAATLIDRRPGPEETAEHAADAVWIRGLLASLTPHQREIVELRLAGVTDLEIARTLGRSHGSVRTTQYRALQHLRARFGSSTEEESQDAKP